MTDGAALPQSNFICVDGPCSSRSARERAVCTYDAHIPHEAILQRTLHAICKHLGLNRTHLVMSIDDIAVHIDGYDRDKILYGGNEWRCRIGVFFYEVARVVSAWAVIAMAAKLTIVGGSPAKKGVVYNRNRSFYISMAVCLIAVAGCFPFLVIVSRAEGEDGCSS